VAVDLACEWPVVGKVNCLRVPQILAVAVAVVEIGSHHMVMLVQEQQAVRVW
jgi:hypothetical protein